MQSEPLRIKDEALSPHESKPPAGKRGLKQRIVDEVIKFWIAALYLWVMFGVFALHESVVSGKHHIDFHFYGLAIANAIILGKVMLVAEDLHFADWFKDRPLIYPILCKAFAFSILFLVFYAAEEVIVGIVKGKTIRESIPTIGGGSPSDVFFVGIILSIALIPFFAFREIGRAIGERELHVLLFLKRDPNRGLRALGKRLLSHPRVQQNWCVSRGKVSGVAKLPADAVRRQLLGGDHAANSFGADAELDRDFLRRQQIGGQPRLQTIVDRADPRK